MIAFILDDWAGCQDSLGAFGIVCQTIAQELECLEIFTNPDVKQTNGGKNLTILWRKL